MGVFISNDLTWNNHISYISRRVYGTLYRLKHRGHALPSNIKSLLISALIFPIIDYGCLVYNDSTDYLNRKLSRMINSCLRFIFGVRRDEHITPYRLKSKWLSIKSRRQYFQVSLFYSIIASSKPSYLHDLFPKVSPELRRSSRNVSSPKFEIPSFFTDSYKYSFRVTSIKLWESLPVTIRHASSLESFKNELFNHLLAIDASDYA